ncbi:MAG: hypothetical protein JST06_00785 [Bacteroidetes bacterium]|nr:hypothetical protein [Bacteroidota bacterium]MBS1630759.1 hypothetical protein [Bacteroidota bacterium]
MKKYVPLLLAGAMLAVASCGNNASNTPTQAQIDSMAAARADSIATSMKAQNDSLINASAKQRADSTLRADSIARAAQAVKTPAPTQHTAKKTVTHTKTESEKVNDLFKQNQNEQKTKAKAKEEENKVNGLFK